MLGGLPGRRVRQKYEDALAAMVTNPLVQCEKKGRGGFG